MASSKYNAKPTIVDGIRFDSKGEASRYCELKNLQHAGMISNLERQPKFEIAINGIHCFTWKGDFAYFEGGARIIEDYKGFLTPLYKLKRKCVQAAYGIKIRETGIRQKRSKPDAKSIEIQQVFREETRRRA